MDGLLRSGKNDDFVIGYYVEADRPFYSALARNYTTLDQFQDRSMVKRHPLDLRVVRVAEAEGGSDNGGNTEA